MTRTIDKKLDKINSSPELWIKNIKILNNENELVPFELMEEQKILLNELEKLNIVLKSRQIGSSSFCLALVLYYAHQLPNTSYMILSYDDTSIKGIFQKLKQLYYTIPDALRVDAQRDNDAELLLKNGSRIIGKVAGNKSLGRGLTLQMIVCSEYGIWDSEQQESGLAALEPCLSKNKNAKLIIESTAKNSTADHFYKISINAKNKRSRYKLFFFPWYINKIQYRQEYVEAEEWYKSENHGARLSEKDLTPYELDLYKSGCSLKQLMWRQWKLLDNSLVKFQNEYPSTIEEAFSGNNQDCVFNQEILLERMNYITNNKLSYLSVKDIKPLPESLLRYYGKGLYIYKDIKAKEWYFAGVDTAMGLGGDRDNTAVCVLDSSGEQIATFYRNDIPVYKMALLIYDLGLYFNYMMILPEINTSGGSDLIVRLKKEMGYINILKTKRFDAITGKKKYEYGWQTSPGTKEKLISDGKEFFEKGLILINDIQTLQEMAIYVEKGGKLGNVKGSSNHDDNVIALCLAIQALKANKSYL